MLFSVFVAGAVLTFWAGTAWLQRSAVVAVDLPPAGPYRILSSAGPIEVTVGRGFESAIQNPTFEYDASWLLFGPDANVGDLAEIEVSCHRRFPCRAASRLGLPDAAVPPDVTIGATEGDVSVNDYAGDLLVATSGSSSVFLASVGGRITVDGEDGDVFGYGLTASDVEVETTGGAVELEFAEKPALLVVRSEGGAVTIALPDGDYAVSVDSETPAAISVGQAADADSKLQIHARGPVRIEPKR